MELLGRLHPLIVHFPIALLVLGAAVAVVVRGREHPLRHTLTLLLRVGACGAIAAAATGWLLAGQDEYHGAAALDLERHRWLGLGVAVTSATLALLAGRLSRSAAASVLGMALLALGVGTTGYLGGELVFGEGYLLTEVPEVEPELTSAAADGRIDFRRQVQPILRRSCHKCHSGRKHEGDLRLDRKDLAMQGGEEGPVIVPGEADKSELIRRITLERTDEDYMPAKGAPLTPAQIQTLKDWVNQGADWPE